jgi:predicted metal-dependent peptidase
MDPVRESLEASRIALLRRYPFMGYLAMRLEFEERKGLNPQTIATDGKRIYYNRAFIESLTPKRRSFAVMHEISHFVLKHFKRAPLLGLGADGKPDKRLMLLRNICTDHEVNLFVADNLKIIGNPDALAEWFLADEHGKLAVCYDEQFIGLPFEEIWERLKQQPPPATAPLDDHSMFQKGADGDDQKGEQSDEGDEGDQEEEQSKDDEEEDQDGKQSDGGNKEDQETDQSEEGGEEDQEGKQSKDGESDNQEDNQSGDGEGLEGLPQPGGFDQGDEIRLDAAILQAAEFAKQAGKLPGSVEDIINRIKNPIIPWKQQLRNFMQQAARDDYSWKRPNRHYMPMGIYIPGVYSETIRSIVMAVDTSGSISDEDLQDAAREAYGIACAVRTQFTIIQCDAQIQDVKQIKHPADCDKIEVHGRGGTSFAPVFDHVRSMRPRPQLLIYFTDLQPDRFPERSRGPGCPLLWIATTDIIPPYGAVIRYRKTNI